MNTPQLDTELADLLIDDDLSLEELWSIVKSANACYDVVYLQCGLKKRKIYKPQDTLMAIQRIIAKKVLSHDDSHPKVFSYKPSISLLDHAEEHLCYAYTLKMDIHDFFGSITRDMVKECFLQCFSEASSSALTDLVCLEGSLPMGAPTSPILSNLVLRDFDEYWTRLTERYDSAYTRYSDDIFISSDSLSLLENWSLSLEKYLNELYPSLEINPRKTKIMKGNNRKITGLILTQDGEITIGRSKKRLIRVLLDKYSKGVISDKDAASLKGNLLFAQGHDPKYFNKLLDRFGESIEDLYCGSCSANTEQHNESLSSSSCLMEPDGTLGCSPKGQSLEEIVLEYIAFGWNLLPCFSLNESGCQCGNPSCKSPGKHPCVKHGVYSATNKFGEIQPWIKEGANIAIATGLASGVVVIDVDINKGGKESLEKLKELAGEDAFQTLTCATGGGGYHYYFKYPSVPLKNRNGFMSGIDFRTNGGYVIAPPSIHKSGRSYKWVCDSSIDVGVIKQLPECLSQLIKN